MIYAVCIGKARDGNNNITQYKLRDFTGQETIFDARGLKEYISKGRITVCNLTLTSDNKLMEKKVESLADLGNNEKVQQTNMGNYPNTPSVIPEQHSQPHGGMGQPQQPRGGMGQSAPTNSVDPSNAYKTTDMLYYVTREGNLNIKHIPSNTEETLTSKVGTACFVPAGHRLVIFYTIVNGEDLTYKYMILDMTTNDVIRNKQICSFTGAACIGKRLCPTNEHPYYKDKNTEVIFVPIRAKENGTVTTVGMLALDRKDGEHFFVFRKGINAARSLSRLMGALTYSGNNTVPLAVIGNDDKTLDLRCTGMLISLNKKLQMIECATL